MQPLKPPGVSILYLIATLALLTSCSSLLRDGALIGANEAYSSGQFRAALTQLNNAENHAKFTEEQKPYVTFLRASSLEGMGEKELAKGMYQFLVNTYPSSEYAAGAKEKLKALEKYGQADSADMTRYEVVEHGQHLSDQALMMWPKPGVSHDKATARHKALAASIPTNFDSAITILRSAFPEYPEDARRDGIQGIVRVEFVVNENGDVEDAVATESPDARLSEASIRAIKTWHFSPLTRQGKPVKAKLAQRFPFRLNFAPAVDRAEKFAPAPKPPDADH
jgi:TonB family protein